MKTITRLILVALVAILNTQSALAQKIQLLNLDDNITPPRKVKLDLNQPQQSVPSVGEDAVIWSSGPSIGSVATPEFRLNVMGGLFYANVPTDRRANIAAWHRIPTTQPLGLQWFDCVSTTNIPFWLGSMNNTTNTGHRLILSVQGSGQPSAYEVRITSSLTNIPTLWFNIATNTANNTEIAANSQYVLVNSGANGTNETYWSSVIGRTVAGGDDTRYDNGEYPSALNVSYFKRLGSTFVIYANSEQEIQAIRQQFAHGKQWIKAELSKNGVWVASSQIDMAMAEVVIMLGDSFGRLKLGVVGGQENSPYAFESVIPLFGTNWSPFLPGNFVNSGGASVDFPQDLVNYRFIRGVAQ
mgnify:CR=1 FL=1